MKKKERYRKETEKGNYKERHYKIQRRKRERGDERGKRGRKKRKKEN